MVRTYYPDTAYEAMKARSDAPGALLVSGGTDVMVRKPAYEAVIILNGAGDLAEIRQEEDGSLFVGAEVTYADMMQDHRIPEIFRTCIPGIASPAIRNAGTMTGNICNASPAGDTLPVLSIMDAQVVIGSLDASGQEVSRTEGLLSFIQGIRKIDLLPTEVVLGVRLPLSDWERQNVCYYQKVGSRRAESISKASFAASARVEDGTIKDLRASWGSVGIKPVRFPDLEKKYAGTPVSDLKARKEAVTADFIEGIHPIDDQRSTAAYRRQVSANLFSDFIDSLGG